MKIRGVPVEVMVEPITDREGVDAEAGRETEVMIICGTRYVEWRAAIA